MKLLTFLLCCLPIVVQGQPAPATMTKLTVRLQSPDVPPDSFAAQPKTLYRASNRYCRTEEVPDVEQGIHGLVIINEPDVWMVNRFSNTAQHLTDPGPTFNCRMPIFVPGEDFKSAADVTKPIMELEFGRELKYFEERGTGPVPGPKLQGKSTKAYTVNIKESETERSQLFLFLGGEPERPLAVAWQRGDKRQIFWYNTYEELPFDAKLFAKPEGVKVEELKSEKSQ
jgi:hypothetical protein